MAEGQRGLQTRVSCRNLHSVLPSRVSWYASRPCQVCRKPLPKLTNFKTDAQDACPGRRGGDRRKNAIALVTEK